MQRSHEIKKSLAQILQLRPLRPRPIDLNAA